jgi:hypothetical protein
MAQIFREKLETSGQCVSVDKSHLSEVSENLEAKRNKTPGETKNKTKTKTRALCS